MQLRRILVARGGPQAVGVAIRIASQTGAQLVLAGEPSIEAMMHDAIESGVRRVAAELVTSDDEIIALATEGFDVVIGSRGALGDELLHVAPCSVIAIDETERRPARHVACSVDFSAAAHAALELAVALRPERITLLGVRDALPHGAPAEEIERWAAALYAMSSASVATRTHTGAADPALRIRIAADATIDAIAAAAGSVREPLPAGYSLVLARL